MQEKKTSLKALDNYDELKDVSCSVCMEYPHNAVLLLCSSYDKGCRPYMCATSHHHSNCLEQYKNACTKVGCCHCHVPVLVCPLCRGQVKGWTVVESARKYFDTKKRACMQDNCSFVGSYKELRKHVKAQHPCTCPRETDASCVLKWKRLEEETDRNDVISTIRSSMPGAILMGDYVIDRNYDHEGDLLEDSITGLDLSSGSENEDISSHGRSENHQYTVPGRSSSIDYVYRFTRYHNRFLSRRFWLRQTRQRGR